MQLINVWGIRITLIHVAFQGPIVTYPKIVEPWRGVRLSLFFSGVDYLTVRRSN